MKKLCGILFACCLLCTTCIAAGAPLVSATSAILVDAGSGRILYEKDAHTQRRIASTTKLMTALVAVESTPDLSKVVTITAEHWVEGTSMYLKPGEEVTLEDLLYGLLLQSGNDAAMAIATGCAGEVETFVEWMNQWAEELGMENTHFANPSGLDQEGHYSTAYDMSLLAVAVLKNETLREIVATKTVIKAGRNLKNHNKLLWQYEGCIGMKTGYTSEAGRTLVSCAQRDGQTLICVTLHDPDDWADHAMLFNYGFESFPLHVLTYPGKIFRRLPVTGSLLPQVSVATANEVVYPLAANERVRVAVMLPEKVKAPVVRGETAGKLIFSVDGEVVGESELLYTEEIPGNSPEPTLLQKVKNFLQGELQTATLADALLF